MKTKFLLLVLGFSSMFVFGQTNFTDSEKVSPTESMFDYSALSWLDAFDSLHATLSLRYPYTEWKAVDWDEKLAASRQKFVESENSLDSLSYIINLYEYLFEIPDGHIAITGVPDYYKRAVSGGSYGFNLSPLDDGSVVVSAIDTDSQAYASGLKSGDCIVKWNDTPIDSVGQKEFLNYYSNYATVEGRKYSRYLALGRDSIGAVASVSFINSTGVEQTTALTTYDDERAMMFTGVFNTAQPFNYDSIVTYKMLENSVGYLKIGAEVAEGETVEEILQHPHYLKVKEAVAYFNANSVDKLIVDLRFNLGGNDLQAAVTMGLFYQNSSFYENITASYDNNYQVEYTLMTEPLTPCFTGEIAVIVDPNCISTGEGFAMMFQRLENAQIVSHWGTNGSFGMVSYDPVLLPLGLSVVFPQAMSLTEDNVIQLDSDSTLTGGVQPDIKVPLNSVNCIKQWRDGIDVQLEYAESLLLDIEKHYGSQACIVYPNPCSGATHLKFNAPLKSDSQFYLFDLKGRLVLDKCVKAGENSSTIDLENMKSGHYYYELIGNRTAFRGKIVVSK